MLTRLKRAWWAFFHEIPPRQREKELEQLVRSMWQWTNHKDTKWAKEAYKVLCNKE